MNLDTNPGMTRGTVIVSNQNKQPILSILTPINKPHALFIDHAVSVRDKALSDGDVEWVIGVNNATENDKKGITDIVGKIISNVNIIDYGNVSLGETRNNLIRDSHGKYVLFVDSDDILDMSMPYLRQFIANEDYDLLFPESYYEMGLDGKRILKTNCSKELFLDPINNFKESKLFQYMWGKVIRRDLAEKIHFYDCNMFEDVGAFIDLCSNSHSISVLRYPIYIRTKSELNTSGSVSESTYRGLEVCVQHWNEDFPDGSMRNKLDNLLNYMKSKGNVDEERLKRISDSYCQKK